MESVCATQYAILAFIRIYPRESAAKKGFSSKRLNPARNQLAIDPRLIHHPIYCGGPRPRV